MTIQRFDTGPRMSKAVVNGNTVYLAGIVADAPKGKSMGEQTKSILAQIDGLTRASRCQTRASIAKYIAPKHCVAHVLVFSPTVLYGS